MLEFSVKNEAAVERVETVRASVPFPQGGYANLDNVVVSGHQTAWHIMQRWPDGTVRIAQAQFTDVLPANSQKVYRVARDVPALAGPFTPNAWVTQLSPGFQLGAEVLDTFNAVYRAYAGPSVTLQETPLVRVKRYRTLHNPTTTPNIGRDYLSSTFYVTEYRDMPILTVDWIFGNDYQGADVIPPGNLDPNLRPLGMIDVRSAGFLVKGASLVLPYRWVQEGINPPEAAGGGFTRYRTLSNTWIEDGQTRRYRFHVLMEHPSASQPDKDRWRTEIAAMNDHPLYPLARIETWQETDGAGLLGGPIRGPADAYARAEGEYQSWNNTPHFGPWGSRGDALATGTTGTPRNSGLSPELGHAIQANHHRLLQKLEQKAWAQAMRPYHLWQLQVWPTRDILLWDGIPIFPGSRDLSTESLGRRALWAADPYAAYRSLTQPGGNRAHGWEHFDLEHWSSDLLFDYWTISGDEWAREELRQLGESLMGVLRFERYGTRFPMAARAEGWSMQGLAQVYLATGDERVKTHALRRVHESVDVYRYKNHPSKTMQVHGNYPGTGYPGNNEFFMPWQHGGVLYGYLGAFRFFGDQLLLQIAEDVVTTVEYGWVTNYNDPIFGFIPNGLRYYIPFTSEGTPIPANYWDAPPVGARFGDSPLGGAHTFLVAGLYLLADWSGNPTTRQKALHYGQLLWAAPTENSRWDKWFFQVPRQRAL
ncbi:MAG: hypothetical protein AB7O97_19605 [Planctomycetota bacterium]